MSEPNTGATEPFLADRADGAAQSTVHRPWRPFSTAATLITLQLRFAEFDTLSTRS